MENNLPVGLWQQMNYKKYDVVDPTYNISSFSLNTLKEVIEKYFHGKKIPYEKELQSKLRAARERIEYNETWRTPTLEELKDGDEVEILTSWGWQPGTWPSVLRMDTHVNLWGGDTIESKFKCADLRIKR